MTTTKKAEKVADDAIAEVQAKTDEHLAKGYIGHAPDENPNEAYSLLTGPDAPLLVPDNTTRVQQHTLPKES